MSEGVSNPDPSFDLVEWKKLRSKVMRIYYGGAFVLGLLYSGYLATEYIYIRDVVGEDRATMSFSLALGTSRSFGVIAALAGSIYYDFTLKVKQIAISALLIIVAGNVLYLLPYSLFCILFGNMLIFASAAAVSAIIAEVTHIFERDELTGALAIVVGFRTLGMLTGPCLAFAFTRVDVKISGWRLYAGNVPAVVLGVVSILFLCCTYFLKNLAKIYDLKAHSESKRTTAYGEVDRADLPCDTGEYSGDSLAVTWKDDVILVDVVQPQRVKTLKMYFSTAWSILRGRKYACILLTSAFATYSHFLTLNLFTVTAVEKLGWGTSDISYVRITAMLGGLISTILVIKLSKKIKDYLLILGIVSLTILPLVLLILVNVIHNLLARAIVLYISAFVTGIVEVACHIVTLSMIGKIVLAEYQGIGEAVRLAIFQIAYAFSGYGVGVVFNNIVTAGTLIILLNIFSLCLLIYERKRHGL